MVAYVSVQPCKPTFLVELHELAQMRLDPWLDCGDFNMIYRAQDKNNGRLNKRRMGQFHLEGRLFT
jgi:hypothetical protein